VSTVWIEMLVALVAILVLVADFGWERWFRRKP
jgi:hypothetical protein